MLPEKFKVLEVCQPLSLEAFKKGGKNLQVLL
jgi:hypothetical protein